MVYITRKEHFNAAHKLWRKEWSEEKNYEVFGPCSNPNWHGHNFTLLVTVKGQPDATTGFVVNLKKLSTIINKKIIDKVDHKNLNLDVDFMKDKMPSAEVFVMEIWNQIAPAVNNIENCTLHRIKLMETEHNFVEYFGE